MSTEPTANPTSNRPARRKGKLSQERVMLYLMLLFVAGLTVYTIFPEGTGLRELGTASICMLIVVAIFKGSAS